MNIKTPVRSMIAALLLVAVATVAARAQMGYTASSLECLVAGAEVVVRARVAEVRRGPVEDMRAAETVTLDVREAIRGSNGGLVSFVHDVYAPDHIFEAWRDEGREHLWFLDRDDGPAPGMPLRFGRVVRLGPIVRAERGFGPPDQGPWRLPVFTLDLKLIEEPEAILRAARASAAEWKGRKAAIHGIDLPRAVMQRSGTSGDANRLAVPVDRHLEDLARNLIRSPGHYVPRSDAPPPKDAAARKLDESWRRSTEDDLRASGVEALRHFRSEENILLLRPLLDDPAFTGLATQVDGRVIDLGRRYFVREAAYRTLREWGVPAREPVIREPRDGRP